MTIDTSSLTSFSTFAPAWTQCTADGASRSAVISKGLEIITPHVGPPISLGADSTVSPKLEREKCDNKHDEQDGQMMKCKQLMRERYDETVLTVG